MRDDDIIQYYRDRASAYEQIYYRDVPERRREIDDEVTRLRALVTGKDVLELACGSGYWTVEMSRNARSLKAADVAPEMIEQARKKSYRIEPSFIHANMFEVSFGEEVYDVVALGFWFSHQPKQEYQQLFDILRRPLRKSGIIWMIDNNPLAEGAQVQSAGSDEYGNNLKKRYQDNGQEYLIIKNYFSKSQLQACLEPAFAVKSLIHNKYYWSVVLGLR